MSSLVLFNQGWCFSITHKVRIYAGSNLHFRRLILG
jgi:hypothetical protein